MAQSSSPAHTTNPLRAPTPPAARFYHSRLVFVLASFLTAMLAFYAGLAENVFTTPYMQPHIGVRLFAQFLVFAVVFSSVCASGLALLSLGLWRIRGWHYGLHVLAFMIEFSISWHFFVAFFGI